MCLVTYVKDDISCKSYYRVKFKLILYSEYYLFYNRKALNEINYKCSSIKHEIILTLELELIKIVLFLYSIF